MNIISTLIKRPVFTLMLVLVLVVFGLQAFPKLGVDLNPDVDLPVVSITATMTGASPQEIETLLTKPIEDAVSSLSGIKTLSSTSREGRSQTTIEFEYGTDSKLAANEVREKVAAARKKLPDDIDEPIVQRFDLSAQAIGIYSLTSDKRSVGEIRKIANDIIKDELQRLDGVAEVNVYGASEREIHIEIDANKLSEYNLSIGQIMNAVNNQNINAPGGSVTENGRKVSVRAIGKYKSIEDIKNLVVANIDGKMIRLYDVAEVKDGWAEETVSADINASAGVLIAVQKQSGTNTVAVADKVKARMQDMQKVLPEDIKINIAKDGSTFIKDSVSDVMMSLVLGSILAVLITYLFLQNGRATLIGALTIPTSLIATFFLMQIMDFTLNTMSLMALSLAVGIVIDDAIVVVENIYRHMEEGKSAFAAARDATNQLSMAIIATTLTLLAVFVPVGSMNGIVGQFFKQFGLTVSFAVVFSTFVAFTLTPMLAAYFLKPTLIDFNEKKWWQKWVDKTLAAFEKQYIKWQNAYSSIIAWVLDQPKKVLVIALLSLLINPLLLPFLGKEFQPSYDSGEFTIVLTAPAGTSLEKMKELIYPIEETIERLPEKEISYAIIGQNGTNKASVGVKLVPSNKRDRSMNEIMDELRTEFAGNGNLKVIVQTSQGMGGDSRPVQLALQGDDLDQLTNYAQTLVEQISALPGSADVDMSIDQSAPEIQVRLDALRMKDVGLDTAQVSSTLQMAFIGVSTPNQYNAGDNDYDIRLQLSEKNRMNIHDVGNLLIGTNQNTFIRLGDIASIELSSGPTEINRENRQRKITVYANAIGVSAGELSNQAAQLAKDLHMPLGYSYGFAGDAKSMQETFGEMLTALVMGCVLIYMILAAQYGSFVHPFTIMLSLPFAVSGAIVGLLIANQTLNMMSMIGFIMLMGLVTKNAILLVDHANQMREAGMDIKSALINAGTVRLRPILMTTASMIFGVLPIALGLGAGAELRQSMGVVLIGGLITSTLLTLVVVPIIYLLFDKYEQKLQFKKVE
ncbi:efflux RND transporter permease subunit [Anaerosinus sp.]